MEAESAPGDANRRRSGRVIQKPVHFGDDLDASTASNGAKRKRQSHLQPQDVDDDSSSDPESEDESSRRRSKGKASKPAAKKPKTGVTLAMRPATNGVKRSRPRKAGRKSDAEGTGLYAEVFIAENLPDTVAAGWIGRYKRNPSEAMCELINFVLKCSGCSLQVQVDDINDPDNATNRLGDLQDEFQAQKITEYPLIQKKGGDFSKAALVEFFRALIDNAAASELLYSDDNFFETIQTWVTPMSSSSSRPFRHTATVISLSIATTICGLVKDMVKAVADTSRQKLSEEKKKTVNRGRVTTLKQKIDAVDGRRKAAEAWLKDIFDTVFVHRYRDVDPKIRVDCCNALGTWIVACPDVFFDSSTIRYFGWLLSDQAVPVRAEVVKQLLRLYKSKDNVGRLRAFTDRFRGRMVEMATQDADAGIRAHTIELLDQIREMGLLEPDDIDTVGRLIFDAEPRVRRAVSHFFAENIGDVVESVLEDLGGEETLGEVLGEEAEDDYETPRLSWLKLKCISEVVASYDEDESEAGTPAPTFQAPQTDTRYSLAAGVICEGIEETREWEAVAGFLLFDNDAPARARKNENPLVTFKRRCALSEQEERFLLEVLGASVRVRIQEAASAEPEKRKGRKRDESRTIQELTALHLAQTIPALLRKFGAKPVTASAVLRLEHVLDVDMLQELRQDSEEFASLLDDISKQFLSHSDQSVLQDASWALLHASSFDDQEELAESKVQELWDGTINALRQLYTARAPQMAALAHCASRIATLSSVSDCTAAFESEPRAKSKNSLKVSSILIDLIRGYGDLEDADADALVVACINAIRFYYMWIVHYIRERVARGQPLEKLPNPEEFIAAVGGAAEAKHKLDDTRLHALAAILDTYALFGTLRSLETKDPATKAALEGLYREIPQKYQNMIMVSFGAAEKAYARKAHKNLDASLEDELPEEPESEPESEDEDEVSEHRQHQELLMAEKRLVELTSRMVLAIVGQVLDAHSDRVQKRIAHNKAKLGSNFKEVLNHLEGPKPKRARQKQEGEPKGEQASKKFKSAIIVTGEDDEDEERPPEEVESEVEEPEPEPPREENDDDEIMGD